MERIGLQRPEDEQVERAGQEVGDGAPGHGVEWRQYVALVSAVNTKTRLEDSLKRALAGTYGVYAVQNTWEAGVEREETQGHRLARLAHAAGVEHYVYASVGSAHRKTGIPHFDNKARVEVTVRSLGFPTTVIVRPVFFMENLTSPWVLKDNALYAAMKPTSVLQMIAVDDIGKFGALAFTDPRLKGRAIDIAGDAVTMPEAARVIGHVLGKPIRFVQVPIEEVRKSSEDLAIMYQWFVSTGYDVDIAALEQEFGIKPMGRRGTSPGCVSFYSSRSARRRNSSGTERTTRMAEP